MVHNAPKQNTALIRKTGILPGLCACSDSLLPPPCYFVNITNTSFFSFLAFIANITTNIPRNFISTSRVLYFVSASHQQAQTNFISTFCLSYVDGLHPLPAPLLPFNITSQPTNQPSLSSRLFEEPTRPATLSRSQLSHMVRSYQGGCGGVAYFNNTNITSIANNRSLTPSLALLCCRR